MSVFWFFGPFFDYFFYCPKFHKWNFIIYPWYTKKYKIVRHWFSSKNWIFAIFFKKVSIDGFTHYLWKILLIFIVQSFKNEISSKILDTQKIQHCTTLIFLKKLDFFRFFLRKFLLTVLHIFHRKYTPNFQKIDFSIYPNILYICDQNFMLVPTIKLLEFSDKNWETYEGLLIFWSIFLFYFFYCPKFQKWNFIKNPWYTKIQHCTTLIFLKKLDFCDFF